VTSRAHDARNGISAGPFTVLVQHLRGVALECGNGIMFVASNDIG
jgi:hypothetical protein